VRRASWRLFLFRVGFFGCSRRLLVQLDLQARDIRVPLRQQLPQPHIRSTEPGGIIRHGLTTHAQQAPTPAATRQTRTH
jgi:hypothetical protein